MDKSDIYWCLSSEGIQSLLGDNISFLSSGIENKIAEIIVNYGVKQSEKNLCNDCINYVLEKNDKKELEIVLFDILLKEYLFYMGETCYKKSRDLAQSFIGLAGIFSEKKEKDFKERYAKAFKYVPLRLNKFPYVILVNLLYSHEFISIADYTRLIIKYMGNTHVHFENILCPTEHPFKGERLLDIILGKDRAEINNYYKEHYADWDLMRRGIKTDYAKVFFREKHRLVFCNVFGNLDIYK